MSDPRKTDFPQVQHQKPRVFWLAAVVLLGLGTSVEGQSLIESASPDSELAQPGTAGLRPGDPLTLADAIHESVSANPQTRAAAESVNAASAREMLARSALLPTLDAAVSEQRRTFNLIAQGFNFPGLPPLVGPFNVFDARARLSQTVFDWGRILQRRSARLGVEISRSQEGLAREQLASRLAVAFIQVLEEQQAVTAADADLQLARDLSRLSDDQHRAGLATGVDVARSQTQVAQDEFSLARAQTGLAQARLTLQRILNVPQGSPLNLSGSIEFKPLNLPAVDEALKSARETRAELRIAQQQIDQAEIDLRTAQAKRLPSLNLTGDYGQSSLTPVEGREDTYQYGAQLSVPIFSGGAIQANIDAARSTQAQAKLSLEDVDQQVEQDVRLALTTLEQSSEQVRAAESSRDLAMRELNLTRDRFTQGLANNVEVTQAQTELSTARFNYVSALATHSIARANLAAAMGRAQQFNL